MLSSARKLLPSRSQLAEVRSIADNTIGRWLSRRLRVQLSSLLVGPRVQLLRAELISSAAISAHHVNFPQPQVAYNVSKAAVVHLKDCLAAEWARYGIRVNTISPGYMDTILNEGPGLERARNAWASRNPMGRMGVPEELTGPLILLTSNAGSYINGADLLVDGESDGHVDPNITMTDCICRWRHGSLD